MNPRVRLERERILTSSELIQLVYTELKAVAERYLCRERHDHTLQPTALVHEAYLRLVQHQPDRSLRNRAQFCALAAQAMRRILVDHARSRLTKKRGGGGQRVTLSGLPDGSDQQDVLDIVILDEALTRLAELNERHARVVELRYFAGMSISETAEALEISEWTVKNDWRAARAWLKIQLQRAEP